MLKNTLLRAMADKQRQRLTQRSQLRIIDISSSISFADSREWARRMAIKVSLL
jgi:hypothetical protein